MMDRMNMAKHSNASLAHASAFSTAAPDPAQESAFAASELIEAAFSAFFNYADTAIFISDPDHAIRLLNTKAKALLGCPDDQILHRKITRFLPGAQILMTQQGAHKFLKSRHTELSISRDNFVPVSLKIISLIETEHGGWRLWMCQELGDNVTPAIEDMQRSLEKNYYEGLGMLTGGIAHELNTPVQFVNDNIHFLEESITGLLDLAKTMQQADCSAIETTHDLPLEEQIAALDIEWLDAELPEALSQSIEGMQRISDMVSAVKDYAHPTSHSIKAVALNDLVERMATLSRNVWKYSSTVSIDLDPHVQSVQMCATPLRQALLCLIANAVDAIQEKQAGTDIKALGTLHFRTRHTAEGVHIHLSDDGIGMSAEALADVFEPGATSKPGHKGLGLAIARQAIEVDLKGQLTLSSTPGDGTHCTLFIPYSQQETA